MIAALSKPIGELAAEDIHELVAKGWSENENVEFKSELTGSRKRKGNDEPDAKDPWYRGGDVGVPAKEKIFKEIVAFANRSGGRLFIGIQETAEKPSRAKQIMHLPRCHDLAEILERSARDLIEPPLSSFTVHGVVTEADGSSGVVVFEVGRSVAAPHRSKIDSQCYIRRGTESRPMTMTEIQDVTLRLSRHLDEVTKRFEDRRQNFEKWLYSGKPETHRFNGLRISAIPVSDRLHISRVFRNSDVVSPFRHLGGRVHGIWEFPFELTFSDPGESERSILRGTRRSRDKGLSTTYCSVWCDGVIELGCKEYWKVQGEDRLFLSDILGSLANVVLGVERFRNAAASHDIEYGIEVELVSGVTGGYSELKIIGLHGEHVGIIRAREMPLLLEKISLGNRDDAMNLVLTDILDVCEFPQLPRPQLAIDWS
jgi:hypothetical protein